MGTDRLWLWPNPDETVPDGLGGGLNEEANNTVVLYDGSATGRIILIFLKVTKVNDTKNVSHHFLLPDCNLKNLV